MKTVCAECATPIAAQARFCGHCGASQPLSQERQAALDHYRSVMVRFSSRGGWDEKERAQLEKLRGTLGVSIAEHRRFVAELRIVEMEPPELVLEVDFSTMRHFVVGSRCLIRLRIENRGDLAWSQVAWQARLMGYEELVSIELEDVFPGDHEILKHWITPELAGFYSLEGTFTTVNLVGKQRVYEHEAIQFRVGEARGIQVQLVNIDQRSARVVDNSRSEFATGAERGGVLGEGDWTPLAVEAVLGHAPASTTTKPSSLSPEVGKFVVRAEGRTYRAVTTVAQGDLTTIYEGRTQTEFGTGGAEGEERVAIKVVRDAQDNDLMAREARVLRLFAEHKAAQSKHLPRLLARFQMQEDRSEVSRRGAVLSWIDAKDLISVRETYPEGVADEPATWIMRRVLSALGYAHSLGVVHGNLEPAHIMVDAKDHNIFLLDWCYASIRPGETGDGFVCVNELYSPPEVAERRPPIPASDLYSLGKTMIFLLGGDVEAETFPSRVDERLVRMVRYFIRKSPLQRPQDAWEMYDQLDVLRRELFGAHRFQEFVL